MNTISLEEAQRLLRYEPETGEFFWRVTRCTAKAGGRAASVHNKGYTHVMLNGARLA